MKRFESMQAQPVTDNNRDAIKQAEERAWDKSKAIQDMIANLQARTALGTNVQIALALDRCEMVWDQFPNEAQNYRIRQDVLTVRRLIHSALDFYDGIATQKLAGIVPDLGGRSVSPWKAPPRPLNASKIVEQA